MSEYAHANRMIVEHEAELHKVRQQIEDNLVVAAEIDSVIRNLVGERAALITTIKLLKQHKPQEPTK